MRRFLTRKRLLRAFLALLFLWLGSSALVTWLLTRRSSRFAEPAPLVPWGVIEEHRLRTSDGHNIGAWLVRGKRPAALLLLHGNGGTRRSWLPMIAALAQQDFTVLAITHRAHGDSSGETNDFGYSARHDVTAAVGFLEQHCPGQRIVIVAQSLGTAAAIFSARDCAGRVSGYFLESPYHDLKTAVWNRVDHYLIPPLTQAAYLGLRLWGPVFMSTGIDLIRPCDHIASIPANVPVIIFAGVDDRHARIEEARALHQKIQSHAKLIEVTGGQHGQLAALHASLYNAAILDLASQATAMDVSPRW